MYVEQLYTNCLALATYYIESEGEAVVIDPLRDTEDYVEKAKSRGAKIKYIFETHFHADFVSGHIDLAKKTGATIVYGPTAKAGFPIHEAKDGEKIKVGKVTFEVLHTPGHTPESSCFLLYDEDGLPHSIFTGDTLFVGDVGRPDLLGGIISKEELASMMYDSLNNKIKPLGDDLIVYPGHGPGSACGKNIGQETVSTIGKEKEFNYALQDMDKDTFIKVLTDALPPAPSYFIKDATMNKAGYRSFEEVEAKGLTALSLKDFEKEAEEALIIDCRNGEEFEKGFIPNSINVGLDGQFAIWSATVADIAKPVVLVCTPGTEEQAVTRLARTGFQDIRGYLKGGFATWKKGKRPIDLLISIEPDELEMDYKHGKIQVLDIRKAGEFSEAHIKDAKNIDLQALESKIDTLDKNTDYYIHCAGGYRSVVAASIMKKHGFNRVRNVYGGFGKIKETQIPLVNKKPKPQKAKV